jgi:iron complex transport system substrate-binding protein
MASGLRRIVSLAPSVTSILWAVGAADCLVGVTHWCADVAPVAALPHLTLLGDCWNADPAAIAELKPDLVIGSVPYRAQVVEGIIARGLRFLATCPRRLADVYADIHLLSCIVGKEAEGRQLIEQMQERIESVRRLAAKAGSRPLVYCEDWSNPLRNSQPWVAELVEAAGGEFVPQPAGREVSPEEVIAADPEVIVLAWCGTNDRARPDKVRQRKGWERIRAVAAGRIHVVRDELLNTPGPSLADGVAALARIIHPEVFNGTRLGDLWDHPS